MQAALLINYGNVVSAHTCTDITELAYRQQCAFCQSAVTNEDRVTAVEDVRWLVSVLSEFPAVLRQRCLRDRYGIWPIKYSSEAVKENQKSPHRG